MSNIMAKTGHPNFYTSELITNTGGTDQLLGTISQAHQIQHSTGSATTNEPSSEVPQNFQQYSTMIRSAKAKTLFQEPGNYSLLQGHPMPQNGEYYGNPDLPNGIGSTISPSFQMNSIATSESQNGNYLQQQQFLKQQRKQQLTYQQPQLQGQQSHENYPNSMYGNVSNPKQYLARSRNRSTPVCSNLNQQQNSDNGHHHHQQQQQQQQQQLTLAVSHVGPSGPGNVPTMYNNNNMLYHQQAQMQIPYSPAVNTSNTVPNQVYAMQGPHSIMGLPVRNNIQATTTINGTRASSRSQHTRDNSKENGQPSEFPDVVRPKIATAVWDSENTMCYQVRCRGILVSRRQDNNYINGTKLLNVIGMTRGKRDGILKGEKTKQVVKVGSMNLKGVWIPFDRAFELARNEGVDELLYPLFVKDLESYFIKEGHKLKSEANEGEEVLTSSSSSKLLTSDTSIDQVEEGVAKPNMFREEYHDRPVKEEELSYYGSTQNNTSMNKGP